jgi:hypothetical protein
MEGLHLARSSAAVAWRGRLAFLDHHLDLAFPLAMGLLCLNARYPAFVLLLLWLIWRLLLHVERHPLVAVFLILLGAQAGQFVLERDLQPSSVSDPLVIALGFVAMVGRSDRQWRQTLAWIGFALVPLLIWAVFQDPSQRLDLPVGGLNRLGFLLGILQLAAWASAWMARGLGLRLLFSGLTLAAFPLLLANGSRVALLAPALSVIGVLMLAVWREPFWLPSAWDAVWDAVRRWRKPVLSLALALCVLVAGVAVHAWYLHPRQPGGNVLSDRGRVDTALCWLRQPIRRGDKKFVFGLGYNEDVQKHCDGRKLASLQEAGRPDGLPHAHNAYAQIAAENGLLGVLSLLSVMALLLRQLFWPGHGHPPSQGYRDRVFFFAAPILGYLLLTGFVSSFQLFLMSNQILIGLALAALWPSPAIPAEPARAPSQA